MSPSMSMPFFSSSGIRWLSVVVTDMAAMALRKLSRQRSRLDRSSWMSSTSRLMLLSTALEDRAGHARDAISESSLEK
jgi:hypothetical protein